MAATAPDLRRTIVLIRGETQPGQDLFVRGGLDEPRARELLGLDCARDRSLCAIPIVHRNLRNATTAPWKAGDTALDWYGAEARQTGLVRGAAAHGSALDWTIDAWPAAWGPRRTVLADGFGEEPRNRFGAHYWMLDVDADCSRAFRGADGTRWFELKSFVAGGAGWEADVAQPDAPYPSGNHFARCGDLNVFDRGVDEARAFPIDDPSCPEAFQRCAFTLSVPDRGEWSMEVRGDFGSATWSKGYPMERWGGAWRLRVRLPAGSEVRYKLVADGGSWRADPTAPRTDASGNSVRVVSCDACTLPTPPPSDAFDWRDAVIYFVMVDRFASGDASNDTRTKAYDDFGTGTAPWSTPELDYHGGDWAGLRAKIEEGYFEGLGVNVLWLSTPLLGPRFGHTDHVRPPGVPLPPGAVERFVTGYHGYFATDLFRVDPRFGRLTKSFDWPQFTESDFAESYRILRETVAAAHAHGLKVLFDFPVAHVDQASDAYRQHPEWFWPSLLGHDPDGNPVYCTCNGEHSYRGRKIKVCPWGGEVQFSAVGLATPTDPAAKDSQRRCWHQYFLPHWDFRADGPGTASAYVLDAMVALLRETGADGYRLDAVKHVDTVFFERLRRRLRAEAARGNLPGKSDADRLFLVGETYTFDDRGLLASYVQPVQRLDGQFDFPLRKHIARAVLRKDAGMGELATFLDTNDEAYGPAAVMSPFVGNQDLVRAIHVAEGRFGPEDDGSSVAWANRPAPPSDAAAYERLANGLAVLFTNRGAPLVYYGDEIGLAGGGDPGNRAPMEFRCGDGSAPPPAHCAPREALRARVAALGRIRAAHPALRRGVRRTLGRPTADVWGYALATREETVYVVVNRGDAPQTFDDLPPQPLAELLAGEDKTTSRVTIPARQTRIYVAR